MSNTPATDRTNYTITLMRACEELDVERLRRVAKVAFEEMQHQARAIAFEHSAMDWDTSEDPTAIDLTDEPGAAPVPFIDIPA